MPTLGRARSCGSSLRTPPRLPCRLPRSRSHKHPCPVRAVRSPLTRSSHFPYIHTHRPLPSRLLPQPAPNGKVGGGLGPYVTIVRADSPAQCRHSYHKTSQGSGATPSVYVLVSLSVSCVSSRRWFPPGLEISRSSLRFPYLYSHDAPAEDPFFRVSIAPRRCAVDVLSHVEAK